MRADGLKSTVFRGGAWLGAGSFIEQVMRFGRNMLLTRLLAPEAFGTMAIVLSATTLIQVLAEVGAREALIQSPRGTEEGHIGAAWWMSVGRSLSIYSVIYVMAPFISRFYANGELAALARIATLSIVFDGLLSPRAIVAQKQMKFSKWATINNGGGILGVLTTVVLSYFLRDVWALAIGYCSENARSLHSFLYRVPLPAPVVLWISLLCETCGDSREGCSVWHFLISSSRGQISSCSPSSFLRQNWACTLWPFTWCRRPRFSRSDFVANAFACVVPDSE